jgi:predicted neutral ceramidase superfamily lipid hydrolase
LNSTPLFGGLRAAVWLTFVIAVAWVVCFWPARFLRPETGVLWMTLAAFCCLVPGWIVVFLSRLAIFRSELAAMLIQTLFRLGFVSSIALVVVKLRPEIGIADFFGWLIGFYLLALATETFLNRPVRGSLPETR